MDVALIDHHCHGVARGPLDRAGLEAFLTESDRPPPPGCSAFDSMLGIALRQRCAPALDLPAGVDADRYVTRRAQLGPEEANRRLLRAAGLDALLVDTGLAGDALLEPGELENLSGAPAHEVLRLESLAEAMGAPLFGTVIAVREAEVAHFAGASEEDIVAATRWRY